MSKEVIDARERFEKRGEEARREASLQTRWEDFFLGRDKAQAHSYIGLCVELRQGVIEEALTDEAGASDLVQQARDAALASLEGQEALPTNLVESYMSLPIYDRYPQV